MILNESLKSNIKLHAKTAYPHECCGFIILDRMLGDGLFIYHAKNIAPDTLHHFIIDPQDYVNAHKRGLIIAIYHSHKDKIEFSEHDKEVSEHHKIKSLLYCVENDSFLDYSPNGYKYQYVGYSFAIGTQDCFELIRLYYKKELGININNYNRNDNWSKENPHIIEESYIKEDFIKIDKSQVQKHDILGFGRFGIIGHLGLYIGDELILHHPRQSYSIVEPYDNFWKNRTICIFRHNLCNI